MNYLAVAVGQKSRNSLARWLWLRVFHGSIYRQGVTGPGGAASKPAHVGAGKGLRCASHGPLSLGGSQQGSWQSE